MCVCLCVLIGQVEKLDLRLNWKRKRSPPSVELSMMCVTWWLLCWAHDHAEWRLPDQHKLTCIAAADIVYAPPLYFFPFYILLISLQIVFPSQYQVVPVSSILGNVHKTDHWPQESSQQLFWKVIQLHLDPRGRSFHTLTHYSQFLKAFYWSRLFPFYYEYTQLNF